MQDCPIPHIKKDEVLVKVIACGICKTDVDMYKGKAGAGKVSLPIILGHEFSGVVVRVGSYVTGIHIGAHVSVNPLKSCGKCKYCKKGMPQFCKKRIVYGTNKDGGMAEYCAVDYRQIYILENSMSFAESTLAEPLGCCIHAIDKLRNGLCGIKQVVVIGGGTLGTLLLQILINNRVEKIVVIEPNKIKQKRAMAIGATSAVSPYDSDIIASMNINGMDWVDAVFDCVCSKNTLNLACSIVRRCGEIILVGIPEISVSNTIDSFNIFRKEIVITGSCLNANCHGLALSYLSSGYINSKCIIEKIIPFREIISMYEQYDSYNGKIVVML